ncbi:MAG: MCE family protein, partial [Bacteroidales bacterium]|nr:MCE family protein [Bacteroidales bacterium]
FEGGGSTRFVVKMLTSREVLVPINSKVIIYSHDLMGSRAINLILGKSPIMAQNGDTLVSGVQATLQEEVNRQVQPIKKKAEDLLLSIDSVVTTIQTVLNADARSNLAQSFESIRQTISTLEHTTYTIDTLVQTERKRMAIILENIESITTNLRNNNKILTNTIHNIHAVTDSLTATNIRQTFTKLETTLDHLNSVLVKIDNAEGTLGILINDPSLYRELESSSNQLNQLIEDMKLNPKRYLHFSVFGRSGNRAPFVPAPGD